MFALIADFIRESFPEYPIVAAAEAVEDTHSVEHLHERLAGRPYSAPSIDDYRACDDGFSLLTVKGLGYYLPGYMLAAIENLEQSDTIPGHIVSTFAIGKWPYSDERTRRIFGNWTTNQLRAFSLWLGFYTIHFGFDRDVYRCYQAIECGEKLPDDTLFPEYWGNLCDECHKRNAYWRV